MQETRAAVGCLHGGNSNEIIHFGQVFLGKFFGQSFGQVLGQGSKCFQVVHSYVLFNFTTRASFLGQLSSKELCHINHSPEGKVAAALLAHGEHAEQDVADVEQRVVRRRQRSEMVSSISGVWVIFGSDLR